MSDGEGGGVSRSVNTWVQTLAIVFAGIWGAYTFIYLEIARPASAPINLSTEISIREAGEAEVPGDGPPLVAIELQVNANNPSTRTVYLLPNYWRATGYNVGARDPSVDWVALSNNDMRVRAPAGAGQHYGLIAAQLVAAGNALPDTELKPNETVSRTYVFYVPVGAYDLIDVETALPSASQSGVVDIEWQLAPDGQMTPHVYRLNGEAREEVTAEGDGTFVDPSINLQQATSRRQLSMWRPRAAAADGARR